MGTDFGDETDARLMDGLAGSVQISFQGVMIKKQTKKRIARLLDYSWGYILLPVILWGWVTGTFGFGPIAIMSALALGFSTFRAETACGAPTRDQDPETGDYLLCRNQARGVFGSCRQYRAAHRWGKAKMLLKQTYWGRLLRALSLNSGSKAAALSALATSASTIIALAALGVTALK